MSASSGSHTPGPWTAHGWGDNEWEINARDSTVCNVPGFDDHTAMPSNAEADARLIAAAPDMLAALKSLTAVFSSSTRTTGSPGYAERSGERVVIVRELGDDERDAEVGCMYRVRFCDGTETDAFADELTPIGDRRTLSLCMAAIRKAEGADNTPAPLACKPGLYSVEQHVDGEEPTDFGVFRVNDDGSVDWTDETMTQGIAAEWERMRFTAHGETPESIGALIGDMIRDTVPEQWCDDGEIVVEFIRP